MVENIVGIATMTGEPFRRWQQANARAWQFVKLDADDRDAQTSD